MSERSDASVSPLRKILEKLGPPAYSRVTPREAPKTRNQRSAKWKGHTIKGGKTHRRELCESKGSTARGGASPR